MSEAEKKSLLSNAYRVLEPGEVYQPVVGAEAKEPELTLRSVVWRGVLRDLHGGGGVFGAEGGPGDGIGDSDFDPDDRAGAAVQAALEPAGKRDYHWNWRSGGRG